MNGVLIEKLIEALPQSGAVLTGEEAMARAGSSWSRMGTPIALVRPSSSVQTAAVVRACAHADVPVTAWGGRTGLVHGGFSDGHVAISFDRMAAVEQVDAVGATLTVQAGCILQVAAEAAAAERLLLPIDLGARGSATIGGLISTNAGGNRVIRYGMMRDLVLGLEVVLADGTVVTAMNRLIKNNAGYDIKQLFIGSEGTLGIVTRAVLRLRPLTASQSVAFIGVERFDHLPQILRDCERALAGALSAFEVMWKEFHDLVTSPPAQGRSPLSQPHPFYVLIEAQGADPESDRERFEAALMGALEKGLLAEAVIAKSQAEAAAMWALRDDISQTERHWPIMTFDVSLPIVEMDAYVSTLKARLVARWSVRATLTVFGHLGDGNLHLVIGVGSRDRETRAEVEGIVYGELRPIGGSISAEHGIGLAKRDYLGWSRNAEEIAVMRAVKAALDPCGRLNPGKVLP